MLRLLALFLSALLLAAPVHAARALIFVFDELPPWKTLEEGRYGGAYVEIAREMGRRLGLGVDIVNCPLKRCMAMLERGTADIAIGYKATPERRRFLHFLATPYRTRSSDRVFYFIPNTGVEIVSYSDLASLRIGIKLGAEYFERFDSDQTLIKSSVRNTETNFRKLTLGRVDAVLIAEDQGEAILARLGFRHLVSKSPFRLPDHTSRAVAISLRSPFAHRLGEFEQVMTAMVKDGTLAALYRQHYYNHFQIPNEAIQIR